MKSSGIMLYQRTLNAEYAIIIRSMLVAQQQRNVPDIEYNEIDILIIIAANIQVY